jgi:hypothetical protein
VEERSAAPSRRPVRSISVSVGVKSESTLPTCLLLAVLFLLLSRSFNSHGQCMLSRTFSRSLRYYTTRATMSLPPPVAAARLEGLRAKMAEFDVHAYVVGSGDAHDNEYTAAADDRRVRFSLSRRLNGQTNPFLARTGLDQRFHWIRGYCHCAQGASLPLDRRALPSSAFLLFPFAFSRSHDL